MSLVRLARELDETARQTAEMTSAIIAGMAELGPAAPGGEEAHEAALKHMMVAVQAQDRIEQRCRNLADAVRALIASDRSIDHPRFDEIWTSLKLDELAIPELSGSVQPEPEGECEFF